MATATSIAAHTQKGNKRVIKLEKPGGWQKNIEIRSSDKAADVSNEDWLIPHEVAPENVFVTEIYKNPSAPADVRKYNLGVGGEQNRFAFKQGETKVQVSNTFDGLSSEQRADMTELILGKRA